MAFITSSANTVRLGVVTSTSSSVKVCSLPSSLSSRGVLPRTFNSPGTLPRRKCVQPNVVQMSSPSPSSTSAGKLPVDKDPAKVTEDEWRQVLTSQEFNVLRDKGTEYPGTGEYSRFYPKEGHFVCKACGNPLYSASSKFKSGCGWPAFDRCYKDSIKTEIDLSFGSRRIEIMCSKCDSHLGHVFENEGFTVTNERHCVNSISVKYVPGPIDAEEDKLL